MMLQPRAISVKCSRFASLVCRFAPVRTPGSLIKAAKAAAKQESYAVGAAPGPSLKKS
jgi:hypothetical protein